MLRARRAPPPSRGPLAEDEADIPALAELQRALLRSALAAVRPGGVVGYVTCSPVPAETRDVVTPSSEPTRTWRSSTRMRLLAEVPGTGAAGAMFAQLWPHRHGTDAIFIALLRRSAPMSSSSPFFGQIFPGKINALHVAVTPLRSAADQRSRRSARMNQRSRLIGAVLIVGTIAIAVFLVATGGCSAPRR